MATVQNTEIRDPDARASEAVEELRDMQGEKMVPIQRGSVLDCGGPPPLWHCRLSFESARGLAQSKTWRQFERDPGSFAAK
jgi:hypothetical protein